MFLGAAVTLFDRGRKNIFWLVTKRFWYEIGCEIFKPQLKHFYMAESKYRRWVSMFLIIRFGGLTNKNTLLNSHICDNCDKDRNRHKAQVKESLTWTLS